MSKPRFPFGSFHSESTPTHPHTDSACGGTPNTFFDYEAQIDEFKWKKKKKICHNVKNIQERICWHGQTGRYDVRYVCLIYCRKYCEQVSICLQALPPRAYMQGSIYPWRLAYLFELQKPSFVVIIDAKLLVLGLEKFKEAYSVHILLWNMNIFQQVAWINHRLGENPSPHECQSSSNFKIGRYQVIL